MNVRMKIAITPSYAKKQEIVRRYRLRSRFNLQLGLAGDAVSCGPPFDCSDTFSLRAASTRISLPTKTDRKTRISTSADTTDGFPMVIDSLQHEPVIPQPATGKDDTLQLQPI